MPSYTYKCSKHGEFTVVRSVKDEPLKKCPDCGEEVERVWTSNGYIAKCDGFYGKSSV